MARKQISQYLFERIKTAGVDCTFGIPGDYILPLYAAQHKFGLKTVVMTHEPSLGFAADAYARIKGLGVALVTYGSGGLNMINAVACAYAEESPLLIIGGAPETKYRQGPARLHHCVKTFETQKNVYAEVTAASAVLDNVNEAQHTIDYVIDTILTTSRPGYLELPRDMMNLEIEITEPHAAKSAGLVSADTQNALDLVIEHLRNARQAVIFAGVQISRFRLLEPLRQISEALNIPVVTSMLGKSAFPESHPNFIGNYFGQFSNPAIREFVEDCDCIIVLGAVLTEMETGGYSAKLPPDKLILINNEEVSIGSRHFVDIDFKAFTQALASGITDSIKAKADKKFFVPNIPAEETNNASGDLSVGHMISAINKVIDDNLSIVCDTGDCLYAGLSIKTDTFVAPGYYCTMGFGMPASIGVQLANRSKRPIVLVGDGGFQMTGMELSTAVKEGLNPIVIVFNNSSYAMLKFIDQEREYYGVPNWDYSQIGRAVGANCYQAKTCADFDSALMSAIKSKSAVLIDALISPNDISPTLKRLTEHFGKKMRAVSVS